MDLNGIGTVGISELLKVATGRLSTGAGLGALKGTWSCPSDEEITASGDDGLGVDYSKMDPPPSRHASSRPTKPFP